MFEPGTIISERYVIVRFIGKGGMSSVYEAKHIHIGKRVAIKFLSKAFDEDVKTIRRFQQEAKIAGTIGHINICEVMDFGVTKDFLPFIVMEYLEGENLSGILKREKSLPLDRALGITAQILDALDEVHKRGVVHRDLKPGNIFITNVKGFGAVVKLLDFGISKIVSPNMTEAERITKTGVLLGTPNYMAPEQIKGAKHTDHRADLYSCGVILFKMITGRAPFGGGSVSEVILRISEDPIPDPTHLMPGLPTSLRELLRKSMDKNPETRIQSAAEFKAGIEKLRTEISDSHSASAAPSKLKDASAAAERKRIGIKIAFIVAGIIIIASAVIGSLYYFSENRPEKNSETEEVNVEKPLAAQTAPEGETSSDLERAEGSATEKVRIELMNVPDMVRLSYGNRMIVGNVLEVEKGSDPINFTVLAEGFEEREVQITPSKDIAIEVTLQPLTKTKPKGKKKKTGGTDLDFGEEKIKIKEKKIEEDEEKIDHVWEYP